MTILIPHTSRTINAVLIRISQAKNAAAIQIQNREL
jgi:hypothetical protein